MCFCIHVPHRGSWKGAASGSIYRGPSKGQSHIHMGKVMDEICLGISGLHHPGDVKELEGEVVKPVAECDFLLEAVVAVELQRDMGAMHQ